VLDSLFDPGDRGARKELLLWLGEDTPFVQMESLSLSVIGAKARLETCLEDLVESKLRSNSLNSGVNMEDLRVREFTDAELEPIRLWMKVGVELAGTKKILEVTQSTYTASSISFGIYPNRNYLQDMGKHRASLLGQAASRASGGAIW
jgi:hypothetical protein